jgi:hypothetical protein
MGRKARIMRVKPMTDDTCMEGKGGEKKGKLSN